MTPTPWGIKNRVVFLALVPVAIIAIALTVYFLFVRYDDVETALRSRGESIVRQLAPAAEYGVFSGNRGELLRLIQAALREPDVLSITILDVDGQPLATVATPSRQEGATSPPEVGHDTDRGVTEIFRAEIRQPALSFEDPFHGPEKPAEKAATPIGHVVVELSRETLVARKREILLVTLLVTSAVLAVALFLAYRLGRDITEPVLALEDAVARVQAGDRDVRLNAHRSGTLRSLEDGFNEMAVALDAAHRRSQKALAHSEEELARQLEIAQAKKQEAERASIGKSRFLATASHDLRQPLHALNLFAAELATSAGDAHRQVAAQIATAAGAMSELLDALLEASRLDLGAIKPHRQAVALGPLIADVADAQRQSATIKGLTVRCRRTAAWVDTDPLLLRRMIGNLLANAIRYTQRGAILIAARPRGDHVRIEVWDTGIGIEPDHQPYLFREFYQVDNPERDSAKGLGLGLSIVARLGAMLDHPVGVDSRPGHGSRFFIIVPRAAPERTAGEPEPVLPSHDRVGVCVAEAATGEMLCALLQAWGYTPERALAAGDLVPLLASSPGALICDDPALKVVETCLPGLAAPPPLILIGDGEPATDTTVAGRLPLPLRPARLRALLHHLLQAHDGDADDRSPREATI